MNSKIQIEVKKLKLHLQQYPQQATELAISHFEDYLVIVFEYKLLETKVKQLQQVNPDKKAFITQYPFVEANLSLEQQLRVEKFKRFLARNTDESEFWAITYFHKYLILAELYRQAEVLFFSLQSCLSNQIKDFS
ncbi:MAG: hypothetical protein ACRC80_29200, partial [Waterburya sp.]